MRTNDSNLDLFTTGFAGVSKLYRQSKRAKWKLHGRQKSDELNEYVCSKHRQQTTSHNTPQPPGPAVGSDGGGGGAN